MGILEINFNDNMYSSRIHINKYLEEGRGAAAWTKARAYNVLQAKDAVFPNTIRRLIFYILMFKVHIIILV